MADNPTKSLDITPDLLREYKKLIKEISDNLTAGLAPLADMDLFEKMRVERAKELLGNMENLNALTEKQAEHTSELNKLTEDGAKKIKDLEVVQRTQALHHEAEIKRLTDIKGLLGSQVDISERRAVLQSRELKLGLAALTVATRQKIAEEELYKIRDKGITKSEKTRPELWETFKNAVGALPPALADMGEELNAVGLKTAALSLLIPDLGLDKIARDVTSLPGLLDDQYRLMIKSGVMHSDTLQEAYIAGMDPVQAASKEFGQIADEDMKLFMTNVGILPKEMQAAMGAAKNQISLFRESFISANKENYTMAASTANLIAGLKKLGVVESDTAGSIDFFNRALKESPRQAQESVRRLTNVAHSLDVNVADVFKQFGATVGDLSQYGDKTIDVFADLQAQSVATGLDVGKLAGVASKLDTFKGAAVAAQGFNAVLGKTVLSVTDLVHAEPAQKIELLKEAMDRSGISFETANRRVKSMIASMIGAGSVADAARIFGSSEDYFKLHESMDTTAEDIDDLKKRAEETMTVGERAAKMQSSLIAGSQKLTAEAYESADRMSNLLLGTYSKLRVETNDTKEATLSMMTLLVAAGARVSAAKGIGEKVLRIGATIFTLDALAKHLGYKGASKPAIYFIEEMLQKDLDADKVIGDPTSAAVSRERLQTPGGLGVEAAYASAEAAPGLGGGAPGAGGLNITIPVTVVSANGVLLAETTVQHYIAKYHQSSATGKPVPAPAERVGA